ncbi:MAG: ABC transporter substrate-binding protein [Fusobacteriaceae bacterium]
MKKILLVFIMILSSGFLFGKTFQIGVTQIVEHSALDQVRVGFEKAMKDSKLDYVIDYQNPQNDMATQQLIINSFVTKKKDLILAISTPSAQIALSTVKNIPILFAAIADPKSAGLLRKGISGTSHGVPVDKQLKDLKRAFPNAKKVGIVYNTSEKNSEYIMEMVRSEGPKIGLEVFVSGVTSANELPSSLDVLLKKVDVLYMTTDNLTTSSFALIIQKANQNKIPVVGAIAEQVEAGAVFANAIDFTKLGYQTGEMAIKVLKGADVNSIPYETAKDIKLIINEKAAKNYGVDIKKLRAKN